MTFPQKHEDQPAAPALTRGSRQEESNATSLVPDPEDVEIAIANLELDRAALDERRDASSPRYQGATDLGTPAMDNPTPLGRNPSRDATRTNITESVDPETKFLREARPQEPTTRPAIRPVRLDSGTPLPSSPAAPASIASSESGDSHEPSDTLRQLMIDRLFGRWQVWAKKEKILKDRHEKIVREAPLRLLEARSEVRRKSLSLLSEASSTTVAPNPDPPMPEYATSGRKSSISPPDAHFTARTSLPDPPPRDVPPSPRRHDDSTLTTLPPHLPDAPPPRRHNDLS